MPQENQLSPSQITILSLIDTFRDSLLQKVGQKFKDHQLNHNEEILMLLSLLLRPSDLPKSEMPPQIEAFLSKPLYIAFNQHHGLGPKTNVIFNKVTRQLRRKPEFVSSIESPDTPGVFRPYLIDPLEWLCSPDSSLNLPTT